MASPSWVSRLDHGSASSGRISLTNSDDPKLHWNSSSRGNGKAGGGWVTYVPHGPSAETPDEVALQSPDRDSVRMRADPSRGAASRLMPEQPLQQPRLNRAHDLCRALRAAQYLQLVHVSRPVAACSVEAHVCRQIAAEDGWKPFVRTSKLLEGVVIPGNGLLRLV
jgi:hypothetical protein